MKKRIVSAFFALFSIGVFAQTNTGSLPSNAQDFINQHFSSASVEGVEENSSWKIWADDKYEVRFSNGIELDFDENGNLIEIDSQNNEAIPMTALPSSIVSYIQTNYTNSKIVGWEKQDKEQEVELADGTELEFDSEGNFRKID